MNTDDADLQILFDKSGLFEPLKVMLSRGDIIGVKQFGTVQCNALLHPY